MLTLPKNVKAYRTIGPFNSETVPKGLLREHNTKAGVWGLLKVIQGQVNYKITQQNQQSEHTLSQELSGIIAPEQKHHLVLNGQVTFTITFLKVPAEDQASD